MRGCFDAEIVAIDPSFETGNKGVDGGSAGR